MPSREFTTDYSGRTVDMLLLSIAPAPATDIRVATDVSADPHIVTGIEKLVQRYAQIFLTVYGSVENCNREGTEFIRSLSSGMIYSEETLRSAAEAANNMTIRQIQQEDSQLSTPSDESLAQAEIYEVSIDRSTATVSVTVKITTDDGESYTYVAPIATGI